MGCLLGDRRITAIGVNHHRSGIRHALILITSVALIGCAPSHYNYPDQFPKLNETQTERDICPQITGSYVDSGSSFTEDGKPYGEASLTRLLHGEARTEGADSVTIRGPINEMIETESIKDRTPVASLKIAKRTAESYSKKVINYSCDEGYVWLFKEETFGAMYPIAVLSSEYLWLRKAVDGSLIVLQTEHIGGIVIIFPWGSGKVVWHKFSPAPMPDEK